MGLVPIHYLEDMGLGGRVLVAYFVEKSADEVAAIAMSRGWDGLELRLVGSAFAHQRMEFDQQGYHGLINGLYVKRDAIPLKANGHIRLIAC